MTSVPTQVTFKGVSHSDAIDADIRERVAWLEQYHAGITGVRAVVDLPHRHQHSGRRFSIRLEIAVPGAPLLVVNHEPSLHGPARDVGEQTHHKDSETAASHRDAVVAVHEAFNVARRRLQALAEEQRGAVKSHADAVRE